MLFLRFIWENWFFMALLAPFFMALVNILDIYFVDGVYKDEWDGLFIFSFFQLIPWGAYLLGLVHLGHPNSQALTLALLAGGCLSICIFFYFKSLFTTNDMVSIQVIASLSIPLVPFLSWIISGERLAMIHYVGLGIAFLGALLLSLNKKIEKRAFRTVGFTMIGMVFFLSLSMVIQGSVYRLVRGDFWTGFLLFSMGATITGLVFLLAFDSRPLLKRVMQMVTLVKKYSAFFIMAEGFNLMGVISAQRAISLSPSVSFVSVIESLTPAFVLFLSFILVGVFLFFNRRRAEQIYRAQLSTSGVKSIACSIMALGIYLIS